VPVRFVQKLLGSVTGAGIKRNIADCYEFIVNHYEDGDRIFLAQGALDKRSIERLLAFAAECRSQARRMMA
jgi:uncharacterized protein (DUF2235 family)